MLAKTSKMTVEAVKKSFVYWIDLQYPLITLGFVVKVLNYRKAIVEKLEMDSPGNGDARLSVHFFIDKELEQEVEKEMRDIPFVNKIEKK